MKFKLLLVCLLISSISHAQIILSSRGDTLFWKNGTTGTLRPVLGGSGTAGVASINNETGALTGYLKITSSLDPARVTQSSLYQFITESERAKLAGLPQNAVDAITYSSNRTADLATATNPANINQLPSYRFMTDTERNKLAGIATGATSVTNTNQISVNGAGYQTATNVRQIVNDSLSSTLKNITFTNATVTTSGNSTTISFNGGGSSVIVDNTLNAGSPNAVSNSAVANAINIINANITANTSAIATNTSSINTLTSGLNAANSNIATNTSSINTLTSGLSAANSNIATNTSGIASLSTLVTILQQQVSGITGTFTIQAPTLTAGSITNTSIALSWPASTSATSYTLESATNSSFSTGLTTLTATSGLAYTATGLTAGTTYWFRIKASGGAGTAPSGYGTVSATTTNSLPTLSAPTGLVASAISSTVVSLSWTASSNATGYTVRYSTSSSMSSPTSLTTTATSLTVTGLNASTQYYFDVSASAAGYNTSVTSTTASATTQSTFVISQTIRIVMQQNTLSTAISSGSSTSAVVNTAYSYNRMIPTASQITSTTAGAYSLALVNDVGSTTPYSVSIGQPFTQATASSVASASLVAGMLYPNEIMQRAWQVASTNSSGGSIVISGLNPALYYQVYSGAFTSSSAATTSKFTVTGSTSSFIQKAVGQVYGIGATGEFDSNSPLFYFKNVQPASDGTIVILNNYAGTGSSSPFNIAILRESVNPAP